jgi:hypothetical protein
MTVTPNEHDGWTIIHFSQSNRAGDGQGDVAAILHRVAIRVEALGDIQVQDIIFSSKVTGNEDDLTTPCTTSERPGGAEFRFPVSLRL